MEGTAFLGKLVSFPLTDFQETFYAKPRYPAMDIAYLAIQEKWRGKHIGDFLIKQIADLARRQTFLRRAEEAERDFKGNKNKDQHPLCLMAHEILSKASML